MQILDKLNPQQREAVAAPEGQILVLAGPGSGKTRVLTYRIAYLVQTMRIPPYAILAVTFTNKAAREMESRVVTLVEENIEGIWLGTFHAMCARLLRRESNVLPFKSNFVIMDSDDQESLVKRALKDLKLDEKLYRPQGMKTVISAAKNDLIMPADYPAKTYRDEINLRVYTRYQELLQENNAVDFDDLLLYAVKVLRDNPPICERYARKFEHVLVDEFQDTNTAQYELLRLLSSWHKNIFVVGDEDQSIYRWRGADYRNVLRFEKDYPQCQKILLEQNYRSTQTVLDAARAVIDHNTNRTPKHLFSDRGAGEKIMLHEAADDHAEAAYVVDTIRQWVSAGRAHGGDFAVMYRTNAQSRLLEEAFLRAGMSYRLVGAQRFYGRREVKDVIAYLRLAQNPSDEVSLTRIIGVPPRGIGDKTITTLQLAAHQANLTPGEVLLDLGKNGDKSRFWEAFRGRGAMPLADFGSMLAEWSANQDKWELPTLFDRILSDIGYQAYINDNSDEGADRWGNVDELRRLAFEYKDRGLTAFLENLALVSDQDTVPEKSDTPTLLTLHAAKGLEFNQVFITGLDEGLIPHSRSRDDPEEMAEERRLFYVGITRAKDRLTLVRAERRSTYGSFEDSIPSRFLDNIPNNLLQVDGPRRSGSSSGRPQARSRESFTTWQTQTRIPAPPEHKSAPVVQQRYKAGMRVRHASWGEGLIVDARLTDNEERVDVFFDSVGFKRLLASMANLEII